jgi:hypothetical protein
MKPFTIAVAAVLLTSSAAAAAQSASDAECILLSNVFANNTKDPTAQKAAEAALYFYLGRVSDKTTAAQLKALFEAQAKTLDDKTAGPKMNACVQALQTKVKMMQSLSPQAPKQPQGR